MNILFYNKGFIHNTYLFILIILGSCYIKDNGTACLCLPIYKDPTCGTNICNCSCSKNDRMCHLFCSPYRNNNLCNKFNETKNLCHPEICKNGGTCIIVNGQPTCR